MKKSFFCLSLFVFTICGSLSTSYRASTPPAQVAVRFENASYAVYAEKRDKQLKVIDRQSKEKRDAAQAARRSITSRAKLKIQ